jgi:DNA repair protein RadA/Sms
LALITIDRARERGLALPIGSGGGSERRIHYVMTPITSLNEVASSGPGIVRGIAYLLTGGPGAGKSTLLIQVAVAIASKRYRVVYAFLEPGEDFIHALSLRLGLDMSRVRGVSADSVDELIERVGNADFVVLDSLQGLSQRCETPIDEIALRLAKHAHETNTTWFLIGHINKEGDVSGVMATEHWVDTTIHLSREYGQGLRVLSSGKNRYGEEQVRFLRMTRDHGLVDVPDASSHLLADRAAGVVGSCVGAVLVEGWQGSGPKAGVATVLVETQALVTPIPLNEKTGQPVHPPRIVASGVPSDRMRVILAVLKNAGQDIDGHDVTVTVCGGIERNIKDRSLEAPMALAILSSFRKCPVPAEVCAWGEVDLTGRLRSLADGDNRSREAVKAGFRTLVHTGSLSAVADELLIDTQSKASQTRPRGRTPADARMPDARREISIRVPAKPGRVRKKGARR